jgi:hypothetical protein
MTAPGHNTSSLQARQQRGSNVKTGHRDIKHLRNVRNITHKRGMTLKKNLKVYNSYSSREQRIYHGHNK